MIILENLQKTEIAETELKCPLSLPEYEMLVRGGQAVSIYNYYFLSQCGGMTLRIRKRNGIFELTAKTGGRNSECVNSCIEHTVPLSKEQAEDMLEYGIDADFLYKLTGEQCANAQYSAQNKVLRSSLLLEGIPVDIDACRYYGIQEYELECESPEHFVRLKNFLKEKGIELRSSESKSKRTFTAAENMDLSHLECVLFDLDGTVLKSDEAIIPCLKETFRLMGYIEEGDYFRYIGPPLIETMEKLFPGKENSKKAEELYLRIYDESKAEMKIRPYDGIKELFDWLKSEGIIVGIATSKGQSVAEDCLKRTDINPNFIVGANKSLNISAKADILKHALNKYGLNKEKTVLVGDTFYDMKGAEQVGIDAIGVSYGYGKRGELMTYPNLGVFDCPTKIKEFFESKRRRK